MRTVSRALAAALLLAGLLTGCGGGDGADSAYCSTLKEERKVLTRLADQAAEPGTDVLTPTLEALGRLREASPPDLRDDR